MFDRQRRLKHKRFPRALRRQAARLAIEVLERRDVLSPTIVTTSLPSWTVNQPGYLQTIQSTGAVDAVTFSETGNLPPGLTMTGPSFNTIDDPTAEMDPLGDSFAYGVSGSSIVGTYQIGGLKFHGFLYDGTTFHTIDDPSASAPGTYVEAISGSSVVGFYYGSDDMEHGFLYNGSTYTTLDDPSGSLGTQAYGVSGNNIVGVYNDTTGSHGFLYNGSTYTTLDDPLAVPGRTFAAGVSGNTVVGYYQDASEVSHGFLYDGTTFRTLDDPAAGNAAFQGTFIAGLSSNDIVGSFVDSSGRGHGFFYDGSTFTTIDEPAAAGDTNAFGISGTTIVGTYQNGNASHGFTYNMVQPTLSGTPTATGTYTFSVTESDKMGTSPGQQYTVTINPAVAITTSSLPAWTAGQTGYNQVLNATGGTGTLTFSSTGTLPPGLTLSSTGNLSGTPTTAGSYSFAVMATDTVGATGSQSYTVTVNPPVTISTTVLANGTSGVAYNQTISATGGTGTLTFSPTAGTLPTGLTLSSSGVVSGTPTATGTFSFTVGASDSLGASRSQSYSVTINPPAAITVSPSGLPDGDINVGYSQTLSATGGTSPYTFALTSGTLPAGLTLDSGGLLSGTPTGTGSFTFTVTASDAGSHTGTQNYTITIHPAVAITTSTLTNWTVSQPGYSQTIVGTGGLGNLSYSASGALPTGLTLSSSGVLSGTPSAQGSFSFSVTASDSLGVSASQSYTVTINGSVSITTATLPDGTTGTNYSQTISATGGTGSKTFAASAGTVPTGLTLSSTGVLSGTPTASGSFTFTITATDTVGASGSQAYTITIASSTPTQLSFTAPATAMAGTSFNVTITAEDSGGHTATGFSGTVTLSSTAGSDIAPTSVVLTAGTATIPVTLTAAGSQTLTASFTGLTSGTAAVTVSPGSLQQYLVGVPGSGTVQAGSGFLVTAQAADAYGNPIYNYSGPTSVTASVTPTSAASNFPASIAVSSTGLGLFLGNLQKVGSYTISVGSGSLSGSAVPLTVTPAAAAKLGFATQPVSTPTGLTLPAVTVQVQDQFGNVVTKDNSDTVTLNVASGPGGFASASTTSAGVTGGVATFNNLSLIKPGTYILGAKVSGLYTGPNSAAFTVLPLQVVAGSFVGTPTGFSLQFNTPILINSTTPVLYGQGFKNTAPVPSVTLTQTADGSGNPVSVPITGSLIVSAATNTITFLATDTSLAVDNSGDPLLPDGTYTVDLTSSGVTGFQAINSGGGFLDGKGNGHAGSGDYIATFTVSAQAAGDDVLWVPATADGPGQMLNGPGDNQRAIGYPVYLNDSSGTVTNVLFTLNYDPTLLTVTGASGNSKLPGSSFTLNTALSSPGHAVLQYSDSGANSGNLTGGQVPLGYLSATVTGGTTANPVPYRAKDLLHLSGASINSGAIPVATGDGLHVVAYVGDADGNGAYSSNDAVLITRVGLQTDVGFAAYSLIDPVIVVDTDGAGFIPADAALQTNEAGVGFNTANLTIPPIPPGVHFAPVANNVDPALSVDRGPWSVDRSTVTVAVNLDDAHPAGSTGLTEGHLALTYDPRAFTVSAADVHLGSLLATGSGWNIVPTIDPASGQIAIALSSDTPITSTQGGSLVTIDFHALGQASNPSSIALVASANPNGQYVITELEDTQGTFTLTPAPTNTLFPRPGTVIAPATGIASVADVVAPGYTIESPDSTDAPDLAQTKVFVPEVNDGFVTAPATSSEQSSIALVPEHAIVAGAMVEGNGPASPGAIAAALPAVSSLGFAVPLAAWPVLPVQNAVARLSQTLSDTVTVHAFVPQSDQAIVSTMQSALDRALTPWLRISSASEHPDLLDLDPLTDSLPALTPEPTISSSTPPSATTGDHSPTDHAAMDRCFAQMSDDTSMSDDEWLADVSLEGF